MSDAKSAGNVRNCWVRHVQSRLTVVLAIAVAGILPGCGSAIGSEKPTAHKSTIPVSIHHTAAPDVMPTELTEWLLQEDETMAAAKYRWIATTHDWGTAGNWDQNQVPNTTDNGDEILFDGTSNVSPTVGMDRTGDANNGGCIQITTTPQFRANIGSPGNPLKIEIDSTGISTDDANTSHNFTHRGNGTVYLYADDGGFMDVVCDAANPTSGVLSMELDGTIRNLFIKRGIVYMKANAAAPTRIIVYGPYSQLIIDGSDSGNLAGNIYCLGGSVTNARRLSDRAVITGGYFMQTGTLAADDEIILMGGHFDYRPAASSANEPSMFALGGHLDFTRASYQPPLDLLIIGPNTIVSGDPFSGVQMSSTAVNIDLRDDYP